VKNSSAEKEENKHPLTPLLGNPYFRRGLFVISIGVLVFFVGIIIYRMIAKEYQISLADIILIALLILLSSGVLDSLSEISFGEKGFFARFNRVEHDLTIIHEVAKHVLTQGEFLQLTRLIEEEYVRVSYSYFLLQEMIRLCQHNFVKEKFERATWDMKDKYEKVQDPYNLKEFYYVTEDGRSYFELLKKLKSQ
jgi:hypothetical protein